MIETNTYELAGKGVRLIALIVDSIIFGIIGGIFGLNGDLRGGGVGSGAVATLYQGYFLTRHNGQTPGKMLMGIRVIKTDGAQLEGGDAVLRYLGYVIGAAVVFLGFIWAFFDKNNQGWHDKIANTYVVSTKPVQKSREVAIPRHHNNDYSELAKQKNEDVFV